LTARVHGWDGVVMPRERLARRRSDTPARPAKPASAPVHHLLQLQRSAGNAAVARALLARQVGQPPRDEKKYFMAWVYESHGWRPSTGLGNFDVSYDPKTGVLDVTVKSKFWFRDGKPEDFEEEEDPRWKPDEILKWKADFMRRVSAKWSNQFTFHCTRDGWEDLQAAVQVHFVEADEKNAHYTLEVTKIPEVETRRSRVRRPKHNKRRGKAFLDSGDLSQEEKGDYSQTVAFHEAGHMLGLGDEYNKDKKPAHEKLVEAEFGHGVPRHKDGRLMSQGDLIGPEYGVTFLEALRMITGVPEWSFNAKQPAHAHAEPVAAAAPGVAVA
jgi:hypothetical protein